MRHPVQSLLCALVIPLLAAAEPEPAARSILVFPLRPVNGVTQDIADLTTSLLSAGLAEYQGYRVVSLRDIEQTMTQEQLRQLAGCDSTSCAAEIGGALNTDELTHGTIGKVGDGYFLTVTRVRSTDAMVLGRGTDQVERATEALLLQRMPALLNSLMAGVPKRAVTAQVTTSATRRPGPQSATPAESPTSPVPVLMRVVGGVVLAGAGAALLAGLGMGAVFLVTFIRDAAQKGQGSRITGNEAVVGTVGFYGGLIMLPLSVIAALGAGVVLGASWVVP